MDEDLTILEAALYVAGRPLALEELAGIIGKAESTAIKLLENLMYEYDKRKGALEVVLLPRHPRWTTCIQHIADASVHCPEATNSSIRGHSAERNSLL
jgi:hypothetical protein